MTHVHYLTTAFPGPRAGAVHIGRMTAGFAEHAPTTLVRTWIPGQRDADLRAFCGPDVHVATLRGWPAERPPRVYTAGMFAAYAAYLAYERARGRLDWIHTRNQRLARVAGRAAGGGATVALELHRLQDVAGAAAVPGVDFHVVISQRLADALADAGVDRSRIILAPDAVDVTPFTAAAERVSSVRSSLSLDGAYVIGYTGHLYADRGLESLIDALGRLPDDVVLLCVGGQPDDVERVRAHVAGRGMEERVRMVGRVPPNDVAAYQVAADVLVAPYGSDLNTREEASPLKVYEYLASRRPMIITDLPFVHEIVDERSAVIVPPDDAGALASAVERLRTDSASATAIADAGYQLVAGNSWGDRAATILASARTDGR